MQKCGSDKGQEPAGDRPISLSQIKFTLLQLKDRTCSQFPHIEWTGSSGGGGSYYLHFRTGATFAKCREFPLPMLKVSSTYNPNHKGKVQAEGIKALPPVFLKLLPIQHHCQGQRSRYLPCARHNSKQWVKTLEQYLSLQPHRPGYT